VCAVTAGVLCALTDTWRGENAAVPLHDAHLRAHLSRLSRNGQIATGGEAGVVPRRGASPEPKEHGNECCRGGRQAADPVDDSCAPRSSYQLGYGIAAFGVGPLLDGGVALSSVYAVCAGAAAAMGLLSFAVARPSARRAEGVPVDLVRSTP
jgi:hypothetical protein